MDGARVADLERALAIHETVFRHLLVVREGADDAEPETADAIAPHVAVESTTARQPVVAAAGDDDSADEADNDDDDGPAALVAATEEEN
jgi:hypothetical protein